MRKNKHRLYTPCWKNRLLFDPPNNNSSNMQQFQQYIVIRWMFEVNTIEYCRRMQEPNDIRIQANVAWSHCSSKFRFPTGNFSRFPPHTQKDVSSGLITCHELNESLTFDHYKWNKIWERNWNHTPFCLDSP